ncbi:MAG TPA: DinB family protein [Phnomibacter sp.]|nr:DinB family protein [Phnomibacter sp.]
MDTQPEYWLRGPVPGLTPLLQPVAHALLQARKEVLELMDGFPDAMLWHKPMGLANPAFHLRHLTGVLDRLFTYARGQALSSSQQVWLKNEGAFNPNLTVKGLLAQFSNAVDVALQQLAHTQPEVLTQERKVGRQQLPSTVIGLLFHAAEHTMRHTGQLLVTAKILKQAVTQRRPA